MVFASGTFLFIFLPITLIGYWMTRNRSVILRNIFLLLMSTIFYLYSGIKPFILLVMSMVLNYLFAIGIAWLDNKGKHTYKKCIFVLAVVYNIGMLFIFKYLSFVTRELGNVIGTFDKVYNIALPLGISFYTFQALSYVIDVYRDSDVVEKNPLNVALYISFFPQLVAGPIVRWEQIRTDLRDRGGYCDYNAGFRRFAIGLGKKVIIANQMAIFADKAYDLLARGELSTGFAWLGAIAYTLQIYYDFSGYSDMAIGLGQIFGFHFPENFNYPYISSTITEFWRRWHISLSTWFRDYVYIPLGGNRCSKSRMFFNLFIVWMLTGIWHGANYTFWLWGLCYFILLSVEKLVMNRKSSDNSKRLSILGKILGHMYTLMAVVLLWVIFRADSVTDAIQYMATMFGAGASGAYAVGVTNLYLKNCIGYMIIAVVGCIPWANILGGRIEEKVNPAVCKIVSGIWIVAVFVIACCMTIDGSYNPFIYFNF